MKWSMEKVAEVRLQRTRKIWGRLEREHLKHREDIERHEFKVLTDELADLCQQHLHVALHEHDLILVEYEDHDTGGHVWEVRWDPDAQHHQGSARAMEYVGGPKDGEIMMVQPERTDLVIDEGVFNPRDPQGVFVRHLYVLDGWLQENRRWAFVYKGSELVPIEG